MKSKHEIHSSAVIKKKTKQLIHLDCKSRYLLNGSDEGEERSEAFAREQIWRWEETASYNCRGCGNQSSSDPFCPHSSQRAVLRIHSLSWEASTLVVYTFSACTLKETKCLELQVIPAFLCSLCKILSQSHEGHVFIYLFIYFFASLETGIPCNHLEICFTLWAKKWPCR